MFDAATPLSRPAARFGPAALRRVRPTAGAAVADQLLMTALALVLTGLPVGLNFIGQPLAVGVCLALAMLVAARFERAVPNVLLICFTFQATFVAYASAYVAEAGSLDAMKSYNFVTTVGVWAVLALRFVHRYRDTSPFVRRLTVFSGVALLATGCYFVPGLAFDARGATIYLRNIALPLMLFQIAVNVGSRHRFDLGTAVALLLGAILACGYVELFFIEGWLDLTHGWSYLDLGFASSRENPTYLRDLRQAGSVIVSPVDLLRTQFLNTGFFGDLGFSVIRIQGPNFHPISFGYVMAALGAVAAVQGAWWLVLAALPILAVVGAKGAIVLLLASLAFVAAARLRPTAPTLLGFLLALAAYAAVVFRSGLDSGDYHVLGLLGGLAGFAADPLGHTLGQGGNLSVNFSAIDFQQYQRAGVAALAVESAVGVLLYQMGLCGFGLLAFYGWVAGTCWRLYRRFGVPALSLSTGMIAVTLVNGLFQEEALFAPLALGLVMLLVGLTLGAVDRAVVPLLSRPAVP